MNMIPPTLTVAIPAYNAASTLEASVTSVQQQTWKGTIEILIYNDGSTDNTQEVAVRLAKSENRIRNIGNAVNKGRPYARNMLLQHARGRFFAWQDADDTWMPNKITEQFTTLYTAYANLQSTNIWCVCPCSIIGNARIIQYSPKITNDQLKNILEGKLRTYLHTTLGSTSSMRQVGFFDASLPRLQDLDFFIRFVNGGGIITSTTPKQSLQIYNRNDFGKDSHNAYPSVAYILNKYKMILKQYGKAFTSRIRIQHVFIAIRFAMANRQYLLTASLLIKCFFISPIVTIKCYKKLLRPGIGKQS